MVLLHGMFIFACAAPWVIVGLWKPGVMGPSAAAAATAMSSVFAKLIQKYVQAD